MISSTRVTNRIQFASKNRGETETSHILEGGLDDDEDEIVIKTLKKALKFYASLQGEDGSWPADYGGPLFLLPGLV